MIMYACLMGAGRYAHRGCIHLCYSEELKFAATSDRPVRCIRPDECVTCMSVSRRGWLVTSLLGTQRFFLPVSLLGYSFVVEPLSLPRIVRRKLGRR